MKEVWGAPSPGGQLKTSRRSLSGRTWWFQSTGRGQHGNPSLGQPSPLPSDLPEDLSLLLNLWFFFFTLKYLVIFPGTEEVLVEQEKKFLQVMPMRCVCLSPSNPKHRAGSSQESLILKEMSDRALAALWEKDARSQKASDFFRCASRPWETSSALCSSVSSSVTKRCSSMNHVERESGSCKCRTAAPSASIPVDPLPSQGVELQAWPVSCTHSLGTPPPAPTPSSPERGVWCLWITEAKSARMEEVTQHGGWGRPRARPPTPRTIRTVLCTQPSAFHPSNPKPLSSCSSPGSWVMISINRRKLGPKPRGGNFPLNEALTLVPMEPIIS